jgi:23S rRNA-intervening sequence protein
LLWQKFHNLFWRRYGTFLSGIDCLAEGYEIGDRNLCGYPAVSERRALRAYESVKACGRFRSKQHRGRTNRFSQKEFHHFLSQARGSLVEIETQLLIAKDLKYTAPAKAQELLVRADELGRILNGLISSIKTRAA